jgi:integrase
MSVYRPKNSPFFHYDFRLRGHRFNGTTGETSERAARSVEKVERAQAALDLERRTKIKAAPMTIDIATGRYWLEVGRFHKRSDNTLRAITWLKDMIGKSTRLSDIKNPTVAELVAKRRGGGVKPATVNRYVTEMLRRVLNRARDVWEVEVATIAWKKHLLKEPKERIRELSTEEEARLFAALKPDYHPVVRFALKSGCRLSECVGLTWAQIDWGNRTLRIHGKGDVADTIPMSEAARAILWPLQGGHPKKVFTYATGKEEPCPITLPGLDTAFGRAIAKAGIVDFRFHDLRHTFATRLLRAQGNIKVVQKMLRHTTLATTSKYAHALDEDLRQALEVMENETAAPTTGKTTELAAKDLKTKG